MSMFSNLWLAGTALLGSSFWGFVHYYTQEPLAALMIVLMLAVAALHFHAWLDGREDDADEE